VIRPMGGRRFDFGVSYLNNRYHDPALGSFISVDPLVQETGDPYIYGAANPTTYSDPDGLCPISGPGSAEACKAYAAVDYTTTVHLTDETLTVITAGRPTVHHERAELSNSRQGGVRLDVPKVGEVAGTVSTWSGRLATACLAAAAADKDSSPITLGCAATAGSVSGASGLVEAAADLAEDGDLGRCTSVSLAGDYWVPGGDFGELGFSVAMEFVKSATGSVLDTVCND